MENTNIQLDHQIEGENLQIPSAQKKEKIKPWQIPAVKRNFYIGILSGLAFAIILIGATKGVQAYNEWQDRVALEQELEEANTEISFNEGRAKELWTRKKVIPLEIEKVKAEYERLQAEEQNITFQLTELEKQNILLDNRRQELNKILGETHSSAEEASLQKELELDLDLDRLAYAVAVAETGNCTKGAGLSKNNCFGIMWWDNAGNRHLKQYNTTQESFDDFKRIWQKSYKTFPTIEMARRWTGDDNAQIWLRNVETVYSRK